MVDLVITGTAVGSPAGNSIRAELRAAVRRVIRDEDVAAYVFTDSELNAGINHAIRAYSRVIPREVSSTLALVEGVADYALPENCREIVEISLGDAEYSVTGIHGGVFAISPVPGASGSATFKYRGLHTLPASDDTASTYEPFDEDLIEKFAVARCWETLAGDSAKYYDYQEGDIRENRGKTAEQFRAEAERLYAEFEAGCVRSKQALGVLQSAAADIPSLAGVVTRKLPRRETSVLRTFR